MFPTAEFQLERGRSLDRHKRSTEVLSALQSGSIVAGVEASSVGSLVKWSCSVENYGLLFAVIQLLFYNPQIGTEWCVVLSLSLYNSVLALSLSPYLSLPFSWLKVWSTESCNQSSVCYQNTKVYLTFCICTCRNRVRHFKGIQFIFFSWWYSLRTLIRYSGSESLAQNNFLKLTPQLNSVNWLIQKFTPISYIGSTVRMLPICDL